MVTYMVQTPELAGQISRIKDYGRVKMPCSTCGQLLMVHHEYENLRCPNCLDLPIADQSEIERKVERDLQRFKDDRLITLLHDFSKDHVLLYLMERLNLMSHQFYETRALNEKEFSYLNHLIKLIYAESRSEFGDKYLDRGEELDETIELLIDTQAQIITRLRFLRDGFSIPIEYEIPKSNGKFLHEDYNIYPSEYEYCYWRCIRSLAAGKHEEVDIFDKTDRLLRDFEKPSADEIDTLEDWADTFFEFIINLLFLASGDDVIGEIYTTRPPEHVTVFDIQNLLEEINQRFTDEDGHVYLRDPTLGWTTEEELDKTGEEVFGGEWEEVKNSLVISWNNLDAHPFLFKIKYQKIIKEVPGRPPLTITRPRIVYPRWYAQLLKYQIFPLLQNGDGENGHEILNRVSRKRGKEFERLVYKYLTDQGFTCFHSAELGDGTAEIDVLAIDHTKENIWFIECKYMRPKTSMKTSKGMKELNETFDYRIFKEPGAYPEEPTGQPFPSKVDTWLSLDGGDIFKWTENTENEDKVTECISSDWLDFEPRMFVVSNLTPSYVKKQGVEFRTDLEFVEMIEDEDTVYTVLH